MLMPEPAAQNGHIIKMRFCLAKIIQFIYNNGMNLRYTTGVQVIENNSFNRSSPNASCLIQFCNAVV